jgi:hypothetical protein
MAPGRLVASVRFKCLDFDDLAQASTSTVLVSTQTERFFRDNSSVNGGGAPLLVSNVRGEEARMSDQASSRLGAA